VSGLPDLTVNPATPPHFDAESVKEFMSILYSGSTCTDKERLPLVDLFTDLALLFSTIYSFETKTFNSTSTCAAGFMSFVRSVKSRLHHLSAKRFITTTDKLIKIFMESTLSEHLEPQSATSAIASFAKSNMSLVIKLVFQAILVTFAPSRFGKLDVLAKHIHTAMLKLFATSGSDIVTTVFTTVSETLAGFCSSPTEDFHLKAAMASFSDLSTAWSYVHGSPGDGFANPSVPACCNTSGKFGEKLSTCISNFDDIILSSTGTDESVHTLNTAICYRDKLTTMDRQFDQKGFSNAQLRTFIFVVVGEPGIGKSVFKEIILSRLFLAVHGVPYDPTRVLNIAAGDRFEGGADSKLLAMYIDEASQKDPTAESTPTNATSPSSLIINMTSSDGARLNGPELPRKNVKAAFMRIGIINCNPANKLLNTEVDGDSVAVARRCDRLTVSVRPEFATNCQYCAVKVAAWNETDEGVEWRSNNPASGDGPFWIVTWSRFDLAYHKRLNVGNVSTKQYNDRAYVPLTVVRDGIPYKCENICSALFFELVGYQTAKESKVGKEWAKLYHNIRAVKRGTCNYGTRHDQRCYQSGSRCYIRDGDDRGKHWTCPFAIEQDLTDVEPNPAVVAEIVAIETSAPPADLDPLEPQSLADLHYNVCWWFGYLAVRGFYAFGYCAYTSVRWGLLLNAMNLALAFVRIPVSWFSYHSRRYFRRMSLWEEMSYRYRMLHLVKGVFMWFYRAPSALQYIAYWEIPFQLAYTLFATVVSLSTIALMKFYPRLPKRVLEVIFNVHRYNIRNLYAVVRPARDNSQSGDETPSALAHLHVNDVIGGLASDHVAGHLYLPAGLPMVQRGEVVRPYDLRNFRYLTLRQWEEIWGYSFNDWNAVIRVMNRRLFDDFTDFWSDQARCVQRDCRRPVRDSVIKKTLIGGISIFAIIKGIQIFLAYWRRRNLTPQGLVQSTDGDGIKALSVIPLATSNDFPSGLFSNQGYYNADTHAPRVGLAASVLLEDLQAQVLANRVRICVTLYKDGAQVGEPQRLIAVPLAILGGAAFGEVVFVTTAHPFRSGDWDRAVIHGECFARAGCVQQAELEVAPDRVICTPHSAFDTPSVRASYGSINVDDLDLAFFTTTAFGSLKALGKHFINQITLNPTTQKVVEADDLVIASKTECTFTSLRQRCVSTHKLNSRVPRQTCVMFCDASTPTVDGQCGACVLNPRSNLILGIHSAGRDDQAGITIVTRILIETVIEFYTALHPQSKRGTATLTRSTPRAITLPEHYSETGAPHANHPLSRGGGNAHILGFSKREGNKFTSALKGNVYAAKIRHHIPNFANITVGPVTVSMWASRNALSNKLCHGPLGYLNASVAELAHDSLNIMAMRGMALSAYNNPRIVDADYAEMVPFEDFLPHFENHSPMVLDELIDTSFFTIGPLSMKDTLDGIPSVPGINRININTSGGFEYGKKKAYMETLSPEEIAPGYSDDKLSYHTVIRDNEVGHRFVDEVLQADATAREGESPGSIFITFLKDELRPPGKASRTISAGSVVLIALMRRYYLPLVGLMTSDAMSFECVVGVNHDGPDWGRILDRASEFGNMFGGDYSSFDTSLPPEASMAGFRALMSMASKLNYDDDDITAMGALALDIVCPTMDLYGVLVTLGHSNPSGHMLTTWINGFANSWLARYAYYSSWKQITEPPEFATVVRWLSYGDDFAACVCPSVAKSFNSVTMANTLRTLGMSMTKADKTIIVEPFMDPSELTLLRRSFTVYYLCDWRIVLAPIEESSILRGLKFGTYSQGFLVQTCDDIRNAVREYFQYGEEVYEDRVVHFSALIDDSVLTKVFKYGVFETSLNQGFFRSDSGRYFPTWKSLMRERLAKEHPQDFEEIDLYLESGVWPERRIDDGVKLPFCG
jgi:hypothetical protein